MEDEDPGKQKEDYKISTLKEDLLRLIRSANQAQNDLYTSSRVAEDSVRAFHMEQKERLDELAEKSVLDLRCVTENKSEAITEVLVELTEQLKLLSERNSAYKDDSLAQKYVDSCKEGAVLRDNILHFEGNLDLAESLLSVSRLGHFNTHSDREVLETCNESDETQKKSYSAYLWCQPYCRIAAEHSWRTTTKTSVSENDFYETESADESHLNRNDLNGAVTRPKCDEKILNIPGEKILARYITEFEAYTHRTPCVIPDVTLLADMKLVLIDHYHNSIQLFDEDFVKLDEKSCSYPIGICRLNENSIIVSLRRAGQLAIFEINEKRLRHQRNIRLQCESYLWQVTYKSRRLFVVCDENNIHVLDENGKEYYVIRSGVSPESGYLRYFDVNDNDSQIYICERRGLRCINFKGKLQWLFTNDEFPEKERDKHGHIIEDVCYFEGTILGTHWTLSKIFQISTNGQFLRNVIVEHIEYPRVMTVLGKRLVVTQFHPLMKSKKRRTLKVFELDILKH